MTSKCLYAGTFRFFLASAAATLELQNEILPSRLRQLSDQCRGEALDIWSRAADVPEPVYPADKIQKVWDAVGTSTTYSNLLKRTGSETDTV